MLRHEIQTGAMTHIYPGKPKKQPCPFIGSRESFFGSS